MGQIINFTLDAVFIYLIFIILSSFKYTIFIPNLIKLRGYQGKIGADAFTRVIDYKIEETIQMLKLLNSGQSLEMDFYLANTFASACFNEAKIYGGFEPHSPSIFYDKYTNGPLNLDYLKIQKKCLIKMVLHLGNSIGKQIIKLFATI